MGALGGTLAGGEEGGVLVVGIAGGAGDAGRPLEDVAAGWSAFGPPGGDEGEPSALDPPEQAASARRETAEVMAREQ